jgi:hypothetical protein
VTTGDPGVVAADARPVEAVGALIISALGVARGSSVDWLVVAINTLGVIMMVETMRCARIASRPLSRIVWH